MRNDLSEKIEEEHYRVLRLWKDSFLRHSAVYEIDPMIAASIVYSERVFRTMGDILGIMKSCKDEVVAQVLKSKSLGSKVVEALDFTAGNTYIKIGTARKAVEYAGEDWKNWNEYWENYDSSIKMMCLYMKCLVDFWRKEIDISSKPDILGTVFNITKPWISPKPHKNPVSGGSDVATIIDGEYIPSLGFGKRVLRAYNSSKMKELFR